MLPQKFSPATIESFPEEGVVFALPPLLVVVAEFPEDEPLLVAVAEFPEDEPPQPTRVYEAASPAKPSSSDRRVIADGFANFAIPFVTWTQHVPLLRSGLN